VLGAGCLLGAGERTGRAANTHPIAHRGRAEKPTYTVQRGTIVDSLAFTARVSPLHEAELFFRTDGRVLAVYVAADDAVQAGDRLAELDVSAIHRQLAQATLALETARTELASAEAERAYELGRARLNLALEQVALAKLQGYDPNLDVAAAGAQLDQAELALRQAQARYDTVAHLPDVSMRPESEALQQATLAYKIARAAHDQAAQQAAQHAYDVQSQQKRVELAQLDVERLHAGADLRVEQAVVRPSWTWPICAPRSPTRCSSRRSTAGWRPSTPLPARRWRRSRRCWWSPIRRPWR